MTYPAYWPLEADGEQVLKSLDTPFNWRRPGDSEAPLNAGCKPANYPAKRGPKKAGGFAENGGTLTPLSQKQAKMLAPRTFRHAGAVVPFRAGGNDGI